MLACACACELFILNAPVWNVRVGGKGLIIISPKSECDSSSFWA